MMVEVLLPRHVPRSLVYDFDIYNDPRLLTKGLDGYAEVLREAPELFYSRLNGGHWVATRIQHADVLLHDTEYFSSSNPTIPHNPEQPIFLPLSLDPPEHGKFRKVLMPHFTIRAVRDREPSIRTWAIRIIDGVVRNGRCEFLKEVSSKFPVSIFMELMGLPLAKLENYRTYAEEFFDNATSASKQAEIMGLISQDFMELIAARRVVEQQDIISSLVRAEVDGLLLSDEQLLNYCILLFFAGLDTVVNVLTFSYHALALRPDIQRTLSEDPSTIPGFVEESLRLFGVVNNARVVAKPCQRFNVNFETGDKVLFALTQFGRDAAVNPRPAEIDLQREGRRSLPFGSGPHLCIGHVLARAELRILLQEWISRIPSFQVSPANKPDYRAGMLFAMRSLLLTWDSATGG